MRALLTSLVFLAGLAAVVLVHAPRAHAAWAAPVTLGQGHSLVVHATGDRGTRLLAPPAGAGAPRVGTSDGPQPRRRRVARLTP